MSATGTIYGYCRISTEKQNVKRQIRAIIANYPTAKIYEEVFTGRKTTGRKELEKILKRVTKGDTIVFDSVSRMSRNAEEGFNLYMQLYNDGVNLVFLNEPYISTDTYKQTADTQIPLTGTDTDIILKAVNEYILKIAEKQIKIAFEQAQKEVDDLSKRTKGGIETARNKGKQIGAIKGRKFNVKKAVTAKEIILKHNKSFGGTLSDSETISLANVSRNTFYKYKREITASML